MKVLFLQLVPNVGHVGDIKDVSDSYARNFLIPKGLAKKLTIEEEKNILNQQKKKEEKRRELVENRHKIHDLLNLQTINFTLKKLDNGKTFGGIGERDIIEKIKSQFGVHLEKKHIQMPSGHIKHIGKHDIYINLSKDSVSKIIINVD